MEKINIAGKSLRSKRTALEEEKKNMEKERERLKWKFEAEVAILGEKTNMHTEQCSKSEKHIVALTLIFAILPSN